LGDVEDVEDDLGIIWGWLMSSAQIHVLSTFASPGSMPYPKGLAGFKSLIT
jgi:hypothetical protein